MRRRWKQVISICFVLSATVFRSQSGRPWLRLSWQCQLPTGLQSIISGEGKWCCWGFWWRRCCRYRCCWRRCLSCLRICMCIIPGFQRCWRMRRSVFPSLCWFWRITFLLFQKIWRRRPIWTVATALPLLSGSWSRLQNRVLWCVRSFPSCMPGAIWPTVWLLSWIRRNGRSQPESLTLWDSMERNGVIWRPLRWWRSFRWRLSLSSCRSILWAEWRTGLWKVRISWRVDLWQHSMIESE